MLASVKQGLRASGIALFGLGLIIFGLDMMKEAVAELPRSWDLSVLSGHGPWLYFLVGVTVAGLIQSSSATMMMTLAALNAHLLGLESAAALIIGADLGTTSTTALGSIGGHHIKRQLALSHVLFNVIIDLAALIFLLPLLPVLLGAISLQDPLYGLVAFHSFFNLLGLLAFLPLLKPFARWVEGRFAAPPDSRPTLVDQPVSVPEAALVASAAVLADMRLNSTSLTLHAFHLRPEQLSLSGDLMTRLERCFEEHISAENRYTRIKEQESDLLAFSFDLMAQKLSPEQAAQLSRQTREARAPVYSSKTLNGIRENLVHLRHSENPEIADWYKHHRNFIKTIYHQYLPLAGDAELTAAGQEQLAELLEDNECHYTAGNSAVSTMASSDAVGGIDLSTMLNVNREVHHSLKNLLMSLES